MRISYDSERKWSENDVFDEMRERLKEHWSRSAIAAVDSKERQVAAWSEEAVAWSLLGALNVCKAPDKLKFQCMGRMRVFAKKTLTEFNLEATQEEILALLLRCKR